MVIVCEAANFLYFEDKAATEKRNIDYREEGCLEKERAGVPVTARGVKLSVARGVW